MNWDDYFFGIMRAVAAKSKDGSVKISAVVSGAEHEVLSVGYNGFPRGVDDERAERHARPAKYLWTEHAERNAIYNAARAGVRVRGATMHVPCPPCSPCARAIIQVGITRIVAEMSLSDFLPARSTIAWRDDVETAKEMLREAEVGLRVVNIPCVPYPRIEFAQLPAAICKEFGVSPTGAHRMCKVEGGNTKCNNCGATTSQEEMVWFSSRAGHPWTLCAERGECRERREAR